MPNHLVLKQTTDKHGRTVRRWMATQQIAPRYKKVVEHDFTENQNPGNVFLSYDFLKQWRQLHDVKEKYERNQKDFQAEAPPEVVAAYNTLAEYKELLEQHRDSLIDVFGQQHELPPKPEKQQVEQAYQQRQQQAQQLKKKINEFDFSKYTEVGPMAAELFKHLGAKPVGISQALAWFEQQQDLQALAKVETGSVYGEVDGIQIRVSDHDLPGRTYGTVSDYLLDPQTMRVYPKADIRHPDLPNNLQLNYRLYMLKRLQPLTHFPSIEVIRQLDYDKKEKKIKSKKPFIIDNTARVSKQDFPKEALPTDLQKAISYSIITDTGNAANGGHTNLQVLPVNADRRLIRTFLEPFLKHGLGYYRHELPQIDDPRELLLRLELPTTIRRTTMALRELRPSQRELDYQAIEERLLSKNDGWKWRLYIVSQDRYLMDGHHGWATGMMQAPDNQVEVVQIPVDAHHLIRLIHHTGLARKEALNGTELEKSWQIKIQELLDKQQMQMRPEATAEGWKLRLQQLKDPQQKTKAMHELVAIMQQAEPSTNVWLEGDDTVVVSSAPRVYEVPLNDVFLEAEQNMTAPRFVKPKYMAERQRQDVQNAYSLKAAAAKRFVKAITGEEPRQPQPQYSRTQLEAHAEDATTQQLRNYISGGGDPLAIAVAQEELQRREADPHGLEKLTLAELEEFAEELLEEQDVDPALIEAVDEAIGQRKAQQVSADASKRNIEAHLRGQNVDPSDGEIWDSDPDSEEKSEDKKLVKDWQYQDDLGRTWVLDVSKGRKALPVGTVREFGGVKYQKHADGKWRPLVQKKRGRPKKDEQRQSKAVQKLMQKFDTMLAGGIATTEIFEKAEAVYKAGTDFENPENYKHFVKAAKLAASNPLFSFGLQQRLPGLSQAIAKTNEALEKKMGALAQFGNYYGNWDELTDGQKKAFKTGISEHFSKVYGGTLRPEAIETIFVSATDGQKLKIGVKDAKTAERIVKLTGNANVEAKKNYIIIGRPKISGSTELAPELLPIKAESLSLLEDVKQVPLWFGQFKDQWKQAEENRDKDPKNDIAFNLLHFYQGQGYDLINAALRSTFVGTADPDAPLDGEAPLVYGGSLRKPYVRVEFSRYKGKEKIKFKAGELDAEKENRVALTPTELRKAMEPMYMAKMPEDTLVHRKISGQEFLNFYKNMEIGDVVTDGGPMSTSVGGAVFGSAKADVTMRIEVPKGMKFAPLWLTGNYQSENECLFPPQTKMRLTGRTIGADGKLELTFKMLVKTKFEGRYFDNPYDKSVYAQYQKKPQAASAPADTGSNLGSEIMDKAKDADEQYKQTKNPQQQMQVLSDFAKSALGTGAIDGSADAQGLDWTVSFADGSTINVYSDDGGDLVELSVITQQGRKELYKGKLSGVDVVKTLAEAGSEIKEKMNPVAKKFYEQKQTTDGNQIWAMPNNVSLAGTPKIWIERMLVTGAGGMSVPMFTAYKEKDGNLEKLNLKQLAVKQGMAGPTNFTTPQEIIDYIEQLQKI